MRFSNLLGAAAVVVLSQSAFVESAVSIDRAVVSSQVGSAAPTLKGEISWQLSDGTLYRVRPGEAFGPTGVTVQAHGTNTPNGVRYDIRLRNRTATTYEHNLLQVHLPDTGVAIPHVFVWVNETAMTSTSPFPQR